MQMEIANGILQPIFQSAEQLYGPRDNKYTIKGEFTSEVNQPRIWFPDVRLHNITIQLTWNCQSEPQRVVFQLAHEIIHCLDPIIIMQEGEVNVLEEGLATYFSIEYCKLKGQGDWTDRLDDNYDRAKNYESAQTLVRELISIDKDIIVKIRTSAPSKRLFDITKEDLIKFNLPAELAESLTQKFIRN